MMKTVSIFGGNGFIGQHTANQLIKQGYQVHIISRSKKTISPGLKHDHLTQAKWHEADVTNANLDEYFQSDIVINMVGIIHETTDQKFHTLHCEWTEIFAKLSQKYHVKQCIHISATTGSEPEKSIYGKTKKSGEKLLLKNHPTAIILRPNIVFGPGDQFVNRFAQMCQKSPLIPVIGNGKNLLQPIHIDDFTTCLLKVIQNHSSQGKVFELGGLHPHSFKTILEKIIQWSGTSRPTLRIPYPMAHIIGKITEKVKPDLLTQDQVKLLESNNICNPNTLQAKDLGVDVRDFMSFNRQDVLTH